MDIQMVYYSAGKNEESAIPVPNTFGNAMYPSLHSTSNGLNSIEDGALYPLLPASLIQGQFKTVCNLCEAHSMKSSKGSLSSM